MDPERVPGQSLARYTTSETTLASDSRVPIICVLGCAESDRTEIGPLTSINWPFGVLCTVEASIGVNASNPDPEFVGISWYATAAKASTTNGRSFAAELDSGESCG